MDIAIVAPSPIPFNMGGAEKLLLGMVHHIDHHTNNRIELIKLPTKEDSFWNIIDGYAMFKELNLDHFDMVISMKYPAWMIQHRNHNVYMLHRLRGLYDAYHLFNLPDKVNSKGIEIIEDINNYITNEQNLNIDVQYLFDKLDKLKMQKHNIPVEYFTLPGPFLRNIVHFLDNWSLHPGRIRNYFSISDNVKNRADYFPKNVEVNTVYPPTSLDGLGEGIYGDYLFTVSRLDSAKRVELIVKAMKMANTKTKLIIAGKGPDEDKLKELAASDERIHFVGYLDNAKTVDYYRNCRGVIYVPYDEDYGLVTIEAMTCGKPVITCSDSGGTLEFVKHLETGLVAKNKPKSLANEIERLCNTRDMAAKLGKHAKEFVEAITWSNMISKVLRENGDEKDRKNEFSEGCNQKKKKMLLLSTYPVHPRSHGGQLRIYHLYNNLSNNFDVTILSVSNVDQEKFDGRVGFLREISIPKSIKHHDLEWNIEKKVGIPITDIVMPELIRYTPEFMDELERIVSDVDFIVLAHPYFSTVVEKYKGQKSVIYDSHNVEYLLKKSMLKDNTTSRDLLQKLKETEQLACSISDYIYTCSNEDLDNMEDLYNIDRSKATVVPNGVDVSSSQYQSPNDRETIKRKLGITEEKIIVFIGSWHKPNLEAAEFIIQMATKLMEYKFILMGSLGGAFSNRSLPTNVVMTGLVEEKLKAAIYSIADIAINPMINGSGTNLKIAEYMSHGIPVISTDVGARGYDFDEKEQIVIANIEDFPAKIESLIKDSTKRNQLSQNGRAYIKRKYDWKELSKRILKNF
ncbi:glycosyltransferase [Paenibacillus dendritiformis]|uniref:glycosyltransferase family 4 protein n=1 Tax=Paenibacillus dendritiformis TaxID=130049 RepID=UPI00105A0CE2|nr:glycosyltransferase family 4 protein [Paenibacillus dendritiformis]TDL51864.1 glycosyltransferase [Paenibacillus dendritiformis]